MRSREWATLAAVALLAAWAVYLGATFSGLPERMAASFDFAGKPVGWMPKNVFLWLQCGVLFTLNLVYVVILPRTLERIPDRWVNLPWKDRWFSTPEMRTEAYERLKTVLLWTAAFINAVFLFIYHVVRTENVPGAAGKTPVSTGIGLILGAVAALLPATFWYLRPPRKA